MLRWQNWRLLAVVAVGAGVRRRREALNLFLCHPKLRWGLPKIANGVCVKFTLQPCQCLFPCRRCSLPDVTPDILPTNPHFYRELFFLTPPTLVFFLPSFLPSFFPSFLLFFVFWILFVLRQGLAMKPARLASSSKLWDSRCVPHLAPQ